MSVVVGKRKPSSREVLILPDKIDDLLLRLMQQSFGVKDVDQFVRVQYAYGRIEKEDFPWYRYVMDDYKKKIHNSSMALAAYVTMADSIKYPISAEEIKTKRRNQDMAIAECFEIKKHLMRIVDIFNVDVNKFSEPITAIDREIGLIKKWRQRDNRLIARHKGA